jgi:hypothetical protein
MAHTIRRTLRMTGLAAEDWDDGMIRLSRMKKH